MNAGDIVILDVEKLNSEGAGLARKDNFVIFIKDACPQDRLKCKITKAKKNYAEAEILEIITSSQFRIEPKCKLQKVCGGCVLQHIKYKEQLNCKRIIVEDTLYSILGEKVTINNPIASGKDYNYRCKVQYPVRSRGGKLQEYNTRLYAGYFKPGTHDLVNIKYCPIHPAICDEIIEFIKTEGELLGISGYNETSHSGELRHIVLRLSENNGDILVVLVVNSDDRMVSDKFNLLAEKLSKKFDRISGVAINFNPQKTNIILGKTTHLLTGFDFIEEKLSDIIFKISADTFFQVNPGCANIMFDYIKNYISNNFSTPKLLDAYAGIAAFGITLSGLCSAVTSVELNTHAVSNAIETIQQNSITNTSVIASDSLEYIKQCSENFDIAILDPPRKGCGEEVLKNILRVTKNTIIYVSCSPKSLAQDLKYLLKNNCTIESIQPFDMFPNTPHIENVAIIKIN